MIKCGNKASAELAMPEGNGFLMAALLLVKNKLEVNRLKILLKMEFSLLSNCSVTSFYDFFNAIK